MIYKFKFKFIYFAKGLMAHELQIQIELENLHINYEGPASPKLHTKFHENRPTGSGEEDF